MADQDESAAPIETTTFQNKGGFECASRGSRGGTEGPEKTVDEVAWHKLKRRKVLLCQ